MPHQLSLSFFGTFQVKLADEPVTAFRSVNVEGLLIYLALTGNQSHSRDVVAAMFWPNEPHTVARRNLRQSLYQLRQILGDTDSEQEPYLLITRSTVQFNVDKDHVLDVTDFLDHFNNGQPEKAAALYTGDLLPGFTSGSLPFEEWLRQERERLHQLALTAMFEAAANTLARGDYRAAQNYSLQQLSLEPWREETHQQLMQALALSGDRSGAMTQYETCREALQVELAVEPSEETKALFARIRDQQLVQPGSTLTEQISGRRLLIAPFIGRKDEYEILVKAYNKAVEGSLQMITIVGEAGIGKTRLAEHFLEWTTTQNIDILRGRAFETSSGLPYQALTHVLRYRLDRENAPEDLLSDLWLTQLTRILPELRDRYPDLPAPTQEKATAKQHLFEAITRLVTSLAERSPLIIFVDDWHWADSASLDVLQYAMLRWSEEKSPILLILTMRQESLTESSELQTWLNHLKRHVPSVELTLPSLSGSETDELIERIVEPTNNHINQNHDSQQSQLSKFSSWLFNETDGQPFFLIETLKAMADEGLFKPDEDSNTWLVDWLKLNEQTLAMSDGVLPTVRDIIQNWLERLTPAAASLLTSASVLGQQVTFDRLYSVAGLDEFQAVSALDELLIKQLLLEEDVSFTGFSRDPVYRFSHHKLAQVVYDQAGAARRRLLHRKAFEVLQENAVTAAELSHHALQAGLLSEAIQYSIAAGNDAMGLLAVPVALEHYETAWRLVEQNSWPDDISGADRQDLHANLGRAYELSEKWEKARVVYDALVDYAQSIGAPAMECLGLNRLSTIAIHGFGDLSQGSTLGEQARTLAEQSDNMRGLAEAELNLSTIARMRSEDYEALHHGEKALSTAQQLGHPQLLARCLNSLAYVHCTLRQWHTVESYANESREIYEASGNEVLEADSKRLVGWAQMYTGRFPDSKATLTEALEFSQQIENLWGEVESSWRLAQTLLELGQYGEAIKLAKFAVDHAPSVGPPMMVLLSSTAWGTLQRTLMDLDSALETLSKILKEVGELGLLRYRDWILSEMCAAYALSNQWEQAYACARKIPDYRQGNPRLPMGKTTWYEIEALARGGDITHAQTEIEQLAHFASENRRYQLVLHRSQAVMAQWEGNIEEVINQLQAAVAIARELSLPGEEWASLEALAQMYEQQGEITKAMEIWKKSATILNSLAETIFDDDSRNNFLTTNVVKNIIEKADL